MDVETLSAIVCVFELRPATTIVQLQEYLYHFLEYDISRPMLNKALVAMGETRKKLLQIEARRLTPENMQWRDNYLTTLDTLDPQHVLFMDETGNVPDNASPAYGRSLMGTKAYDIYDHLSRQRFNTLACIGLRGVVAEVTLERGNVDGGVYEEFMIHNLLPKLSVGDVVVLDNASWHTARNVAGATVIDAFADAGVRLLFLPPYSPDLNPIELLFGWVKLYIKDHREDMMRDPIETLHAAFYAAHCQSHLFVKWYEFCEV